ncbi:MAG: serine/threonine protein kinase [Planctomycetota bacterium]
MTTQNVGDILAGGYRIIDIKRGGMGVVYICHQAPDRFYAVKTANFSGHDGEQFLQYFRAEVDLWIRVSRETKSENIVQALLYNDHERWLFLEFIDGLGIHEAAAGRPLHIKHTHEWALGVARGMEVLHRDFKLIHRDLKPQNVLITQRRLVPKVSDLGIAKVLQEGSDDNTIIGTRGYRAPETWTGRTSFCSDIYSFGGLLYFMLTGKAPSLNDGPLERSQEFTPPSQVNARVPANLERMALKCLAVEPSQRYQSFAEIVRELEADEPKTGGIYDDGFRYCKTHGFYSLVGEKLPECLFCDHAQKHTTRLDRALTTSSANAARIAEGTAIVSDATIGLPTHLRGGAGVAAVAGTVTAPRDEASVGKTMTERRPASRRPDPAAGPTGGGVAVEAPHRLRRRLSPLLIVGLILAFAGWALYFKNPKSTGTEGEKNGEQVGRRDGSDENKAGSDENKDGSAGSITTEEAGICEDPDCKRRFKPTNVTFKGQRRAQTFCDKNPLHVRCTDPDCGFRHRSQAAFSIGNGCVACGGLAVEPIPPIK